MAIKNNKRNTTIFMFILLACLGLSSIIINATSKSGKIYGLNQPDGVVLTAQANYSTPPEHKLVIENTGSEALSVTNVTVDNANFEIKINGNMNQTVQPNGKIDNVYSIKANVGLAAGIYEGIITALTDAPENEGKLTTTVKLTVTDSITGARVSMANWSYGDTPSEPALSGGLEVLSTSDYEITYSKKEADVWSSQKPTSPGDYKVKIHVTNPIYTANDVTADFKINKAEKELKIEANSSSHEYDGNAYSDSGYKIYFGSSEVSGDRLPSGDKVSNVKITGSVTYVKDNPADGNKNNIIDQDSIIIENKDYYTNIKYVDGVIKITQRSSPIVITPESKEKEFDGQKFENLKYSASEIGLDGHTLNVTLKVKNPAKENDQDLFYAGSYSNEVDTAVIKNAEGVDVTDCFNIQKNTRTLKILAAEQKISLTNTCVDATENTIFIKNGTTLSASDMKRKFTGIMGEYTFAPTWASGSDSIGTLQSDGKFVASKSGVGEAKVTAKAKDLNGDGVADYKETVKTFKIEVTDKQPFEFIDNIENNQVFTYDGQPKNLSETPTVSDGIPANDLVITYSGTGTTTYNDTNPPTKSGTYKAVYSIADSNPTYTGRRTYLFTINKAKFAKPSYQNEESINKTYTGSVITPDITGFNESFMNVQGTASATTANDYQVKYSLKDTANCSWDDDTTGEVVINWKILKAVPEYTLPTNLSGARGDKLSTVELPAGWSWKSPNTTMDDLGNKNFEIVFTPEDTNNYETVEKTVSVNVRDVRFIRKVKLKYNTSKAPLSPGIAYDEWVRRFLSTCLPVSNNGEGYHLDGESTTVTNLVYWNGTKWVSTSNESEQYIKDSQKYALQTNIYTETGYDFEKNNQKYKNVEVWLNGAKKADAEIANYSEENGCITLYIPIEISYPKKPQLNVNDSYIYNGEPQTASVDGFDYSTMNISGNVQKDAGNYLISVTPKSKWSDGTNDAATIYWIIQKAQPTYELPGKLIGVEGTTLGEVQLPEGFSWEDPDVVLVKGIDKYAVVFTPSDADNYETVTGIYVEVETKSAEEIMNELGLDNSNDYADFNFLRTGDTSNIMYLISAMAISAPGAIALIKKRKNK